MVNDDAMRQTAAAQLRMGSRAFAAGATEALLDASPEIGAKHGSGAYALWQGFLSQRIVEIATAVELDEPSLFAVELNWLYSTLASREISADEVTHSIACLGRTLEDELPSASWDVVEPTLACAVDAGSEVTEPAWGPDLCGPESGLCASYLGAVLSGDAGYSLGLILDAFRGGRAASVLYEGVMMPAQAEIGTLWQRGELGVADEHIATELIRVSMTALWLEVTGGAVAGPAVVVGSVTGDHHDAGVRAASHILDMSGLRGICLGCDMPAEDFAVAATRFGAMGAVVSASMPVHLLRVKETVGVLKSAVPGLTVVVGGPAFGSEGKLADRLAARVGADHYARTPTAAAALLGPSGS